MRTRILPVAAKNARYAMAAVALALVLAEPLSALGNRLHTDEQTAQISLVRSLDRALDSGVHTESLAGFRKAVVTGNAAPVVRLVAGHGIKELLADPFKDRLYLALEGQPDRFHIILVTKGSGKNGAWSQNARPSRRSVPYEALGAARTRRARVVIGAAH